MTIGPLLLFTDPIMYCVGGCIVYPDGKFQ
ncbi:MAG: hypothetical protein A4E45_01045 [Methanosaeta sp. PtaB.Bin039]|nr:MAG: hypothetical protein A4E45_01045 [Methanosaeta sp. PtaB.Bin039]